jgi:hypothetical protein
MQANRAEAIKTELVIHSPLWSCPVFDHYRPLKSNILGR